MFAQTQSIGFRSSLFSKRLVESKGKAFGRPRDEVETLFCRQRRQPKKPQPLCAQSGTPFLPPKAATEKTPTALRTERDPLLPPKAATKKTPTALRTERNPPFLPPKAATKTHKNPLFAAKGGNQKNPNRSAHRAESPFFAAKGGNQNITPLIKKRGIKNGKHQQSGL